MINNTPEADAVILALDSFSKRAKEIIDRIRRPQIITTLEKVKLQALYGELKDDLNAAGTQGRVLPDHRVQTGLERFFLC